MNMMYTMWRSDGLPASTWVCVTASLAISISVVDSDRRVRTIVHRRGRGGMRLARGVTGMDFASSLRKTVTEEEGSDAARPGGRCRDGSGPPHVEAVAVGEGCDSVLGDLSSKHLDGFMDSFQQRVTFTVTPKKDGNQVQIKWLMTKRCHFHRVVFFPNPKHGRI